MGAVPGFHAQLVFFRALVHSYADTVVDVWR